MAIIIPKYGGKMKYFSCIMVLVLNIISCTSTSSVKIGNYENPQKALLVIDMQIDYIGENARLPIEKNQVNNLIITVNKIIDEYHNNNYKIIYTRRVFKTNDIKNKFNNYAVVEGTPGVEIDPRIIIVTENIFDKYAPSMFSNIDFENYLIQNQINELFVCGVMADECVYETALEAFNKGYIVNYIGNAVGSINDRRIENAIRKLRKRGINIISF